MMDMMSEADLLSLFHALLQSLNLPLRPPTVSSTTPSLFLSVLSCLLESPLPPMPQTRIEQTKLLHLLLLDLLSEEYSDDLVDFADPSGPIHYLKAVMKIAERTRVVDTNWKVKQSFLLGLSGTDTEGEGLAFRPSLTLKNLNNLGPSPLRNIREEEEETVFTTIHPNSKPRPSSPTLSQITVTKSSLRDLILTSPPLTPRRGKSTLERMRTASQNNTLNLSELVLNLPYDLELLGQGGTTSNSKKTHRRFGGMGEKNGTDVGISVALESDVETWLQGTKVYNSEQRIRKDGSVKDSTVTRMMTTKKDKEDHHYESRKSRHNQFDDGHFEHHDKPAQPQSKSPKHRRRSNDLSVFSSPHRHDNIGGSMHESKSKRSRTPDCNNIFTSPYSVRNPPPSHKSDHDRQHHHHHCDVDAVTAPISPNRKVHHHQHRNYHRRPECEQEHEQDHGHDYDCPHERKYTVPMENTISQTEHDFCECNHDHEDICDCPDEDKTPRPSRTYKRQNQAQYHHHHSILESEDVGQLPNLLRLSITSTDDSDSSDGPSNFKNGNLGDGGGLTARKQKQQQKFLEVMGESEVETFERKVEMKRKSVDPESAVSSTYLNFIPGANFEEREKLPTPVSLPNLDYESMPFPNRHLRGANARDTEIDLIIQLLQKKKELLRKLRDC